MVDITDLSTLNLKLRDFFYPIKVTDATRDPQIIYLKKSGEDGSFQGYFEYTFIEDEDVTEIWEQIIKLEKNTNFEFWLFYINIPDNPNP